MSDFETQGSGFGKKKNENMVIDQVRSDDDIRGINIILLHETLYYEDIQLDKRITLALGLAHAICELFIASL
jgi:hypothetical protein